MTHSGQGKFDSSSWTDVSDHGQRGSMQKGAVL